MELEAVLNFAPVHVGWRLRLNLWMCRSTDWYRRLVGLEFQTSSLLTFGCAAVKVWRLRLRPSLAAVEVGEFEVLCHRAVSLLEVYPAV